VADYGALAADNRGTEQCGAGEALAAALPAAPASAEWGITLAPAGADGWDQAAVVPPPAVPAAIG